MLFNVGQIKIIPYSERFCVSFAFTAPVTPTEKRCINVTCLHGGTCVERPNGYDCICTPQYTGPHCGGNSHFLKYE